MKKNFYWIHIHWRDMQESHLCGVTIYKRVLLRMSLSAIYSSKIKRAMELIEQYVSYAVPRPLQPRKQSRRKRSIKARGYFETAIG